MVTLVDGNAGFEPDKPTTAPPAGAAAVNATVTPTDVPPTTELPDMLTELSLAATGVTVN